MTRDRLNAWTLLVATGFRSVVPLFLIAAAAAMAVSDGTISRIGPLFFQPSLPIILLVPMLLSVASAAAHAAWPSPVIVRCPRVFLSRALSYLVSLAASFGVIGLAKISTSDALAGGMLRNMLLLSGIALLTTGLAGATYAWAPVVLVIGASMVAGRSESPWSLYSWIFATPASNTQLLISAAVCFAGLTTAIWDPRSPGYLKMSGSRVSGLRQGSRDRARAAARRPSGPGSRVGSLSPGQGTQK